MKLMTPRLRQSIATNIAILAACLVLSPGSVSWAQQSRSDSDAQPDRPEDPGSWITPGSPSRITPGSPSRITPGSPSRISPTSPSGVPSTPGGSPGAIPGVDPGIPAASPSGAGGRTKIRSRFYYSRFGGAFRYGIGIGFPYYWSRWDYPPQPIYGIYQPLPAGESVQAPAEGESEEEPPDPVLEHLKKGRYAQAAALLIERASRAEEEARDRARTRLLLAFVGAGAMDRGIDLLTELRSENAALSAAAEEWGDLVDGPVELRRHVVRAVRYAHDVETAEAWRLVALLMQAEGRHELAEEMEQRAREAETASSPAASDA